ncbi:MAG: hypothetical protein ACLGIN_11520 [Candidatus Sericytochromatia bacterium]
MDLEPSKIIPVQAQAEDFSLWPYLNTLYRWCETQPWFADQAEAAWAAFSGENGPLPDAQDPDQHDRLLRFWSWFALDRSLEDGRRPVTRFLEAHLKDLSDEGKTIFDELTRSHFGVFRVQQALPGRLALLEDMATNARFSLTDKAITQELQKGDLVVGRLYPHGEAYVADPDVHIGHITEAGQEPRLTPPEAEARFYAAMVPAKGHVLDVIDALLVQVDSPLYAEDLQEMIKEAASLEEVVDQLYTVPAYKLRYLHMRDRALFDELLQELWETAGPLQQAELRPEEAAALTRTVRQGLRAIAEGDEAALLALADPKGFLPLYLELFGMKALKRLSDVAHGGPGSNVKHRHQLLPKDGGILTTMSWERDGDRHQAAVSAFATPKGEWRLADLAPPEPPSPAVVKAFEKATHLGWAGLPADPVEAHLRRAIEEVGYSVHDAVDLLRLWREFKALAGPDMAQPGIWAAGVELLDCRYRNEDPDVKALAKSYKAMPYAIEQAAAQIDETLRKAEEADQ